MTLRNFQLEIEHLEKRMIILLLLHFIVSVFFYQHSLYCLILRNIMSNIRHILLGISTMMNFHFVNPQFFLPILMLEHSHKKVPKPFYLYSIFPRMISPVLPDQLLHS